MRDTFATLTDPQKNDQTVEVLDSFYHEAHNEPESLRRRVIQLETEWIQSRSAH